VTEYKRVPEKAAKEGKYNGITKEEISYLCDLLCTLLVK